MLINRSLFSFNAIFEKQMKHFKELIKNGIQIGNTQFLIKIHSFIADYLGRSKLCNSKQFNGYFGFLHCLNRGVRVGRSHCYLSEFLSIPDDVIIDDMHLVDEGLIKNNLRILFV